MNVQGPQRTVLQEINGMSEHVRVLRRMDAAGNCTQIKAVEGQLRTKWDELRALRAGSGDPRERPREGSRRCHIPTL